jgi:GNAT superfamily N-acetyltransferase
MKTLTYRLATIGDLSALHGIAERAIAELQKPFLNADQIGASAKIMGIDTQLIHDGTYFVVESDGMIVGCGGWSRRATLYGGDHSVGRDAAFLDPATDRARIRAMYTDPNFARRGIGWLIIAACENAMRAEGFRHAELMATKAGQPLYQACGYEVVEDVVDDRGGVGVPPSPQVCSVLLT